MLKVRCSILVLLIVAQLLTFHLDESRAQFFTKSSKSIPRMGRRSGNNEGLAMNSYRRMLIDNLVDEYGPNLLAALAVARASEERQAQSSMAAGEIAFRNDQPFDFNGMTNGDNQRDPRSVANGAAETSLAMRALNANRYLQHLASGQPLGSYGKQMQQLQQQQQQQRSMSDK